MDMAVRESPVVLDSIESMKRRSRSVFGCKIDSYWARRFVAAGRVVACQSKKR
jgi:hypothetical protein